MTTLLFNSNYLSAYIPDSAALALAAQERDTFYVRCICHYWPVHDLHHQWGVDDYPGPPAKWAVSFYASPDDPDDKDGELYWISLYPSIASSAAISILCVADADRLFFAVATDDEGNRSLFIEPQSDEIAVWIPVTVEYVEFFNIYNSSERPERYARLVVGGETVADWAKATVEQVRS